MTLNICIGRRVPRAWFKRQAARAEGILSFQEHIWQMIKMSMQQAKRKANESGIIKFVMTNDIEMEDLHYEIHWIKIIIKGSKESEEDEYNDTLAMYNPLGKILKRDFKITPKMRKELGRQIKTRMLDEKQVSAVYEAGRAKLETNNIANQLLEMGIMTHIEWVKDFDGGEVFVPQA